MVETVEIFKMKRSNNPDIMTGLEDVDKSGDDISEGISEKF